MTMLKSCLQTKPICNKKASSEETKPMRDKTLVQVDEEPDHYASDFPPGMMRVTRVELVWPGKYNEDGTRKEVPRVSLPFQVIETINASRCPRKAAPSVSTREESDMRERHDA
jgi:hypothetical protein